MNKIPIASFDEKDKAAVLRDRLQAAGVRAEVYDESALQKFWFMSEPLAGQKVRVEEQDFDRAMHLLSDLDAKEHVLRDAVRCPECGSSRVEYPQFTRKFITTTLVEIFCTTKLLEKQFYCFDCHHTWPKEAATPPDLDILGWPREKELEPSSK